MDFQHDLAVRGRKTAIEHNHDNALLQLPGELLNRIYGYALTVGEVEVIKVDGVFRFCFLPGRIKQSKNHVRSKSESGKLSVELNQMKYVCRQMHSETRRLSFALNKLCFTDIEKGSHQCISFLQQGTRQQHELLTRINIQENFDTLPNDRCVAYLASFCRNHPNVTVAIYRHGSTYQSGFSEKEGIQNVIRFAFRKYPTQNPLPMAQSLSGLYHAIVADLAGGPWHGYHPSAPALPDNLVVFPNIRDAVKLGKLPVDTEGLVMQNSDLAFKKWCKEGI
ncbi:hypothetical protein P280DRAFT_507723 [Massarina eburnea CBS 473.64]|uniref:Uncharacterized protein n=1 Tax=Massarina eburnea CBS 473.64 TaxID=1395130 RepID=A0A6A6RZF6_9PLEO|nr:hypothetical protein P280DRAFT_507723 [Massarina eburnea CBS 473.64]